MNKLFGIILIAMVISLIPSTDAFKAAYGVTFTDNGVILKEPTAEELELMETMMQLEIDQCELKTNETELQECDKKIMEYVNILCIDYGTLESGKCDNAQEYFRERHNNNSLSPSVMT